MIPGIILAAGMSTRMGRPKALLPLPNGFTFVRQLTTVLLEGGVADVLVVGRVADRGLAAEVEAAGNRVALVENAQADRGQLSSVITALNAADRPGTRAVLITPVDLPLIRSATVATLLHAFRTAGKPIARATHRGRHGHPVIFGRAVFDAVRRADPAIGAASVLRSGEFSVLDVEVDDPGVVRDVNTPEDYGAL